MKQAGETDGATAKAGLWRRPSKPLLLCLSHLRWDFVFQRPHHLMTRAAVSYDVVFWEDPVFHDGPAHLDISVRGPGLAVVHAVLPHGIDGAAWERLQGEQLDRLLGILQPQHLVQWFYTPQALAFSRHLVPDVTVYDNMDELSAFRFAPPELVALEDELLRRADCVFTGGYRLFEAKQHRHAAIFCFPSSIDAAHFGRAREHVEPEPADQAAIPHPRLGFFGVIDERLDLHLVVALADLRPDWSIVMIGPTAKIDESTLPQRRNIHWLGAKSYNDLPAYLAGWDVGLMPFALNEATAFISPTKTPEFLAAGVPTVSTPIRDVIRPYGEAGVVTIADSAPAVAAAADSLMKQPRAPWLRDVDALLAPMSWDKTWNAMHEAVDRAANTVHFHDE